MNECDSVARLTSDFDRLSNDMSGFGAAHREKSPDTPESSEKNDSDKCTTIGFDFYVNKLNNMGNAMMSRERNLFSPPFKTREEIK